MCKEHMGVALALKVPVFFVVTKVDICPEHVLKHTLGTLQAILRKPGVKKKPFMVGSPACHGSTLACQCLGIWCAVCQGQAHAHLVMWIAVQTFAQPVVSALVAKDCNCLAALDPSAALWPQRAALLRVA